MKVSAVNNKIFVPGLQTREKKTGFVLNPAFGNDAPDAAPDYGVKVPVSYRKTGELSLPNDVTAHCYKLSNGQRVVIVPKEGETVVKTHVKTGSMNEPDKVRGISHYIEHNLFNGSDGLEEGEFFKAVDRMGASTNASTGFAETNYFLRSNLLNDTDLENKIKLHASMLETPLFKQDKLDKEKGVVCSEINMILSRPETIAENRTFKNLYNIQTSSVDMIGGTTDNITQLTREDVLDYYNKNYYPANMLTVISGEVAPEETMKLVSKYFTSKKQPPEVLRYNEPLKPLEKTVREDIISDKAVAVDIVIGFNGPANNSGKEKIRLEALSELLSGSAAARINTTVKPYSASTWMNNEKISTKPSDGVAVTVCAQSTEENSEKVLKAIFDEIAEIQVNPPSDEEMQIIKKSLLKDYNMAFERSFSINNLLGNIMLDNDLEYLNNYEQIVSAMTSDEIVQTAKKYLDLNKAAITVVHPPEATEQTIYANYTNAVSFTSSGAKKVYNTDKITQYELPNNIRVTANDISTKNAEIIIHYSCDKPVPAKPAAYVILNCLLKEGSKLRNKEDFTREHLKNGITQFTSSGDRSVNVSINCAAGDIPKALQTAKEVLYSPRFDEDAFLQVKKNIREIILMSEDTAGELMDCELFKGQLSGISNKEVLQNLDAVTMQDVIDLYNNIMKDAAANVIISAPFSKNPELAKTLFSELGTLAPVRKTEYFLNKTYKPVDETKVLTGKNHKNQADIIQAYKFKTTGNIKDSATLQLLNIILGDGPSSRLFSDLREQQRLAYSVYSDIAEADDTGVVRFVIKTTTENADTGEISYDNVQKSIQGFHKHVNKMLSEKVSEEELNNAKLNLKNSILCGSETVTDKTEALFVAVQSPYGISYSNKMLEVIDTITPDDIYNAASYIFAGKPVYSVMATENTLKHNEEFLNSLSKQT